jgi:HAD superfamily hydrolase (TIGR01549 family)
VASLKAVTFDLWETLIADDSDEPRRKEMGLRTKYDERRHILWEALNAVEPISQESAYQAYSVADAAFINLWQGHSVTWWLEERVDVILKGLDRTLPADAKQGVIDALGALEVDVPPDAIEGARDCLADLAGRYKLCIASDTIVTPGTGLRQLLDGHGLKEFFSGFAFSDEAGHSKPHRDMFDSASSQLGIPLNEMVHIGDRDHNDVKGPQALGMKAVLFTATRAHDKDITSADAICERHVDLPGIIDQLAAS